MAYFSTEPASERRNVTGKNRVWDFFRLSNETHPANRRQPLQPRRKIRPTLTKTASGIPYWPSRDPIGERGGVNLYGFVANDGANRGDLLGQAGWGYGVDSVRSYSGDYSNGGVSPSPFLTARPRGGWIYYSSIYEQPDGKPLSDIGLWNLLWSQTGVFDKSDLDPKHYPPAGSPAVSNSVLKLWDHKAGQTDVDSIVTVEAGDDCCLHGSVSISVNFVVINVEALNNLFDVSFRAWVRGENYWGTVAHELDHIRSYSARVKAIVDDENKRPPCYKVRDEANKAAVAKRLNLTNRLILEANHPDATHTQNDSFNTPKEGRGRVWVGPGGPNP